MDLTQLDSVKASNDGADLHVVHPSTGEKLGIVITLAGPDSDVFRKAKRRNTDKRLKAVQKGREKLSSAELEQEATEILAACTLDWSGIQEGKKDLECTPENASDLYTRYPWIREQVDEFIGDRANFIKD